VGLLPDDKSMAAVIVSESSPLLLPTRAAAATAEVVEVIGLADGGIKMESKKGNAW
jgi:hypothetical protein